MAAISDLADRLCMAKLLDAAIGRIKQRGQGHNAGESLVGLAAAQLTGEEFLVRLDRLRAHVAGQALRPVAGLASTTAGGAARPPRGKDPAAHRCPILAGQLARAALGMGVEFAIAELDTVLGYSFIVTNLEVATPEAAAAVEHWYRHRTQIENLFRDSKHGAALRHLPSGYPQVSKAWMWGALLAASMRTRPRPHPNPPTETTLGPPACPQPTNHPTESNHSREDQLGCYSRIRV